MVAELCTGAKQASRALATVDTPSKNRLIFAIADAIEQQSEELISENKKDIKQAIADGIRPSMIDRLTLTEERIEAMALGARQVAELPDPVGIVLSDKKRPNGMRVTKVSVPIGLIGIIYESRPNVTLDATALCLKSGNAVILRGGKEAMRTNIKIVEIIKDVLENNGINPDSVGIISNPDRKCSLELMGMKGVVDLLIPRGGAGLINTVMENAKVPVIQTGVGNCHLYVDEFANIDMAVDMAVNTKCSRPSVCNSVETFLVHERIAFEFLPRAYKAMEKYNVKWLGCKRTRAILKQAQPVSEEDYASEYNDFIVSCRVVSDIDEAIEHIAKYGTQHSEEIVTDNASRAERFIRETDAAAVYHNVSTRFTDGFEFGLGAEIGISTQKLHARGPMGLRELTTIKYIIKGDGQLRI